MTFAERLKLRAHDVGNILCMGLDPVLSRIPIEGNPEEVIVKFYSDILDALKSEKVFPATVKPNAAFYEQYGLDGMRALKEITKKYKDAGFHICLDAKRADIGNTSRAYANAIFDELQMDSVTLSPYLGKDSIEPFFREGKGCYILIRTSNPGAKDLQDLNVDGKPLYIRTAEKVLEWWNPTVGGVVGATYPEEMVEVLKIFTSQGKDLPLLIPGIGTQGGTVREVLESITRVGSDLAIHRVNSSSGINYAYEREDSSDYAGAAVRKVKELVKNLRV